MKKFKVGLVGRIIIAMVLGMLLGGVLPLKVTRVFTTFNGLFSQFLGFIIPLLIVGLVAPAIADIGLCLIFHQRGTIPGVDRTGHPEPESGAGK